MNMTAEENLEDADPVYGPCFVCDRDTDFACSDCRKPNGEPIHICTRCWNLHETVVHGAKEE